MISSYNLENEIEEAFAIFLYSIQNQELNWALTGSFRLYLENKRLVKPNDIDILTDENGIKLLNELFRDKRLREASFSEYGTIKSIFGQFKVNNVVFDIMANVENNVNQKWVKIPTLHVKDYVCFNGSLVPALPLLIELETSQILFQVTKVHVIEKILIEKDIIT